MLKTESTLQKLATSWLKDFFIYAPVKTADVLKIKEINSAREIDWSGEMPLNPWKEVLLPHRERLLEFNGDKITPVAGGQPKIACLGMNILDLKALMLYDLVFGNDVYYQKRRENLLIVGYSSDWPNDYAKYKVFSHNFEEDILEHVPFDIFVAKIKGGRLKFYSGSSGGRKMLEKSGINDFTNVQFAGAIAESGPDKRMALLQNKITKSADHALWDELDKICLACGKCSIACPTCFCFDFIDKSDPSQTGRERVRGNCFFNDFSKVAGGHKELDTVKKKIYFWYTHKFLRIPREYQIPGCVSCGRCVKVCPVGIDIFKNMAKVAKIK
jgi:sulfhydrogenase subunit beta (sulfur reductase)